MLHIFFYIRYIPYARGPVTRKLTYVPLCAPARADAPAAPVVREPRVVCLLLKGPASFSATLLEVRYYPYMALVGF